jgi:hypothetical protein
MQTVLTGTIGGLSRGILNDQPFFLPFSESPVSTRLHKETEDSALTHPSDNDILIIGMRRLENLRVRPCLSSNPVYSSSRFSLKQWVTTSREIVVECLPPTLYDMSNLNEIQGKDYFCNEGSRQRWDQAETILYEEDRSTYTNTLTRRDPCCKLCSLSEWLYHWKIGDHLSKMNPG